MIRRLIATLLAIALMASVPGTHVKASEMTEKNLSVIRINDDYAKNLKVLTDEDKVYIYIEDLVELARFSGYQVDSDKKGISEIILEKEENQDGIDMSIFISPQSKSIFSLAYGKEKFNGCILYNDKVYIDIMEIFNYLHVKSTLMDFNLVVDIPSYSIIDFMNYDYAEVRDSFVTQYDILKGSEKLGLSGKVDCLGTFIKNFDKSLFSPTGVKEFRQDKFIEMLTLLNEPDSLYYTEDTGNKISEALEMRGLNQSKWYVPEILEQMSFESKVDALDSISGVASIIESNSKFEEFLGVDSEELNAVVDGISPSLDYAGYGVTAYETLVHALEVHTRAESWTHECEHDMDVLRNIPLSYYPVNKYAQKKVKEIKQAADTCYSEKKYPEAYAVLAGEEKLATSIGMDLAALGAGEVGVVFNTSMAIMSLGSTVAQKIEPVNTWMNHSDLSVSTSMLIHVTEVAKIAAQQEYTKYQINRADPKIIKAFRDYMEIALKSNLRCWNLIYRLNEDGEWENSEKGLEVKEKIADAQTNLVLFKETEKYDFIVEDYEEDYTKEDLFTILTEVKEAVEVQFNHNYDLSKESAILVGVDSDGSEIWRYETDEYDMCQLPRISEVGKYEDIYYLMEDGILKAFNIADGNIMRETETGPLDSFAIGPDGTVYGCGNLRSLLIEVNKKGEIVSETVLNDDRGGNYGITKLEGTKIYFAMDIVVSQLDYEPYFTYDINTHKFEYPGPDWKSVMLHYLEYQSDSSINEGYALIYLDNDERPELLEVGLGEVYGDRIITISGDAVSKLQTYRLGISYIEKGSLLLNEEGNMGSYVSDIYKLENGEFKNIFAGTFHDPEGGYVVDENGDYVFEYEIDGNPVSKETYSEEKEKIFPSNKSIFINDIPLESYGEMLEHLRSM